MMPCEQERDSDSHSMGWGRNRVGVEGISYCPETVIEMMELVGRI